MHTPQTVFQAFERASKLAMRLPNGGPKGLSSPWPEILRLGHEGYCQDDKRSSPLTAVEMQEYETTASWIRFIKDANARRMLWAHAAGVPGWKIAKTSLPPVSQSTVSRRILWSLGFIAYKLNDGETPPAFEFQA